MRIILLSIALMASAMSFAQQCATEVHNYRAQFSFCFPEGITVTPFIEEEDFKQYRIEQNGKSFIWNCQGNRTRQLIHDVAKMRDAYTMNKYNGTKQVSHKNTSICGYPAVILVSSKEESAEPLFIIDIVISNIDVNYFFTHEVVGRDYESALTMMLKLTEHMDILTYRNQIGAKEKNEIEQFASNVFSAFTNSDTATLRQQYFTQEAMLEMINGIKDLEFAASTKEIITRDFDAFAIPIIENGMVSFEKKIKGYNAKGIKLKKAKISSIKVLETSELIGAPVASVNIEFTVGKVSYKLRLKGVSKFGNQWYLAG